jgi:uncharacterized protein (TIGR03083 family)
MEIFEELDHTRAALLEAVEGLGEDALDRKGVVGEWSVKNVLAHIAAWEEWVVQALPRRLDTGTTPDDFRARVADEDRFNAEEVAKREELTPSEQLIELQRTREALLAELRGLDAAVWERRNLWDTWEGTLAEYLRDSIVGHEREHIDELRVAAGTLKI